MPCRLGGPHPWGPDSQGAPQKGREAAKCSKETWTDTDQTEHWEAVGPGPPAAPAQLLPPSSTLGAHSPGSRPNCSSSRSTCRPRALGLSLSSRRGTCGYRLWERRSSGQHCFLSADAFQGLNFHQHHHTCAQFRSQVFLKAQRKAAHHSPPLNNSEMA